MVKNVLALILFTLFISLSVLVFGSTRPQGLPTHAQAPLKLPVVGGLGTLQDSSASEIERLKLQNDLQEEINALGGGDSISLYYKNLKKGYEVTINADRAWVPASMVKAYVVVEAFRQKKVRLVNFDSRVTIKKQNVVPTELESTGHQPLREGAKATIRELVYAMVVQSDNTAYNSLLDVLDRRNITLTLRSLGLTDTVVGEKLSLNDEQYALDLAILGRQPNRTTARDFGKLFDLIYEDKVSDSNEILTIFKKQKINDIIPKLLPEGIDIAHKTGIFSLYLHDGGIVYKPNEPFILAVFTNRGDPTIIAQLSKISYYKSRDVLGAQAVVRAWDEMIQRVGELLLVVFPQ